MLCRRFRRLCRRNVRVSKLGTILGSKDDYSERNSLVGPQSAVADTPSDQVSCSFGRTPETGFAIGSILALKDFERFVFVMSVLEKYPDHNCSILLGCARQDIAEARIRALLHLAESSGEHPLIKAAFDSKDHEETAALETHMEPQC
jgi:hypothetical protein